MMMRQWGEVGKQLQEITVNRSEGGQLQVDGVKCTTILNDIS